jgi:uncharacterized coiled-coil protein SlyX
MAQNEEPEDPVVLLTRALNLTLDSIQIVNDALDANPSRANEIKLARRLANLERRAAKQRAQLDSITETTEVVGPSPEQVERMAALVEKVETATNQALAASAILRLTGEVLDLMTAIAKRG